MKSFQFINPSGRTVDITEDALKALAVCNNLTGFNLGEGRSGNFEFLREYARQLESEQANKFVVQSVMVAYNKFQNQSDTNQGILNRSSLNVTDKQMQLLKDQLREEILAENSPTAKPVTKPIAK